MFFHLVGGFSFILVKLKSPTKKIMNEHVKFCATLLESAQQQFLFGLVFAAVLLSASLCLIMVAADSSSDRIRRTRISVGIAYSIISILGIWIFGAFFPQITEAEKNSEIIIWLIVFSLGGITVFKHYTLD